MSWTSDATFALSNNYTATATHNAAGVATMDISAGYINNMDYPESITFPTNLTFTDESGFLWNDDSEVTTTWTNVDYPNR